jgi:hypothetical protein
VSPQPGAINVGDIFSIDFLIGATDPGASDDVTDLYAYQFGVAYDPSILTANSVSEGVFLSSAGPTFFLPGFIDNTLGLITFNANTLLAAIAGVSGSGSLLSVEFTALAIGTSGVSAVFDPDPFIGDSLIDSTLSPIDPFSVVDGSVTVEAPTSVPEPGTIMLLLPALTMFAGPRRRFR